MDFLAGIVAFLMVLLFIFGVGCLYGYFADEPVASEIGIGTGVDALIVGLATTALGGIATGGILFMCIASVIVWFQERRNN